MLRNKKTEDGNEYRLTKEGIWVRNFTKNVRPIDINRFTSKDDQPIMVENEVSNDFSDMLEINPSLLEYEKCLIISDGYDFERKHLLLANLPQDVTIFAVNRALAKWKINKKIDYYVVNNPYVECISNLPRHRYYPKCIASTKTYYGFLKEYNKMGGIVYKYCPVQEKRFAPSSGEGLCVVDDYRNPICAAIGLAYKFKAKKVMLMCCDDVFEGERAGAEKLKNGYWMYPQHKVVHGIIDTLGKWMNIVDHSSGPEYKNVRYVPEEKIFDEFQRVVDGNR